MAVPEQVARTRVDSDAASCASQKLAGIVRIATVENLVAVNSLQRRFANASLLIGDAALLVGNAAASAVVTAVVRIANWSHRKRIVV